MALPRVDGGLPTASIARHAAPMTQRPWTRTNRRTTRRMFSKAALPTPIRVSDHSAREAGQHLLTPRPPTATPVRASFSRASSCW